MAGITAYVIRHSSHLPIERLVEKTVESTFQSSDLQSQHVISRDRRFAMVGSFPRHFQRRAPLTGRANFTARGSRLLLFYGELYNSLGQQTEAEFVLDRIEERGYSALAELNGPFALLGVDEERHTLTAATDRLGRFPPFYCVTDEFVCITTDLHAVLAAGIFPARLNEESVVDFLTIGFPLGEKSMFEGAKRIGGGQYWVLADTGIEQHTYWKPIYGETQNALDDMMEAFEFCTERAINMRPNASVALSGGWDSRATWAVLGKRSERPTAMTFGEARSTDVEIASAIARTLDLAHLIVEPSDRFFRSFPELAKKTIILGNGHVTVDLAFQLYAFEQLSPQFEMLLDSAGCEFRRGVRARRAVESASQTADITNFLTSMYATGIWNRDCIARDFFDAHKNDTPIRLTSWLERLECDSYRAQVDAFSSQELWAHHYAHGYPLQTSVIACHMPYSDNEFYDLFLRSGDDTRWSHTFHQAVIAKNAPELESIPISHGHCRVPYGDSPFRYATVLYHSIIQRAASVPPTRWLRRFDSWRPFRPYHRWYVEELASYVGEILETNRESLNNYLNYNGVGALLERQKKRGLDLSHGISILLTLAHLVEYVDSLSIVRFQWR